MVLAVAYFCMVVQSRAALVSERIVPAADIDSNIIMRRIEV